jgi:SAM-dependent methyltransferase
MITIPLGLHLEWGCLDFAELTPIGTVRITGWSREGVARSPAPPVLLDDEALEPLNFFRFARPDVLPSPEQALLQAGLILEFRRPRRDDAEPSPSPTALRIGESSFVIPEVWSPWRAHYDHLLDTRAILGRPQIYGEGPPMPAANPEVIALTAGIRGRVLDFGCGSGALLLAMRERGVDAYGLEIDRPPIQQGLHPAARPYVTLYDGALPSPFADEEFDVVVSSEVLEHIPAPVKALAEMVRLTRGTLLLTVPDCAAIPQGFPHGVVPWHLLEATHVNFFNQQNLTQALNPHFTQIDFGRIGGFNINGTTMYTSIVAACTGKKQTFRQ